MAVFFMHNTWNGSHTNLIFAVTSLSKNANEYDKFVFKIFQNGTQIVQHENANINVMADNFIYEMYTAPDLLGLHWVSPNCTYVACVDCYSAGSIDTSNYIHFTTNSISPPDDLISPSVYVPIRTQSYGTCIANSLVYAMEIFRAIKTDVTYEKFSAAYIFGSDGRSNDDMFFGEAVDNVIAYGSPRYEIYSGIFPDEFNKATAVSMFNNADNIVKENADKQRLREKLSVDFYDCESVANCIKSYGYFMFNFRVPNNFDEIDDSGIVPQPDWYTGENHSMALIGLTIKNGTKYWIAQNSWGEDWGQGGRCFIPYDWGCGIQAPTVNLSNCTSASWTLECYSVQPGSGYVSGNPSCPYNVKVSQISNERKVSLFWDIDEAVDYYMVLGRRFGTNRWYRKAVVDTTSEVIVEVDYYDTYEFMVIAFKDDYCSSQSNIAIMNITSAELNPKITTIYIYDATLNCMTSVDITGVTCELYVKQHTSNQWTLVSNKRYGTIMSWNFNSVQPTYGVQYDLKLVAKYEDVTEESAITTINLNKLPTLADPTDLRIARIDKGFSVSWAWVENTTFYSVQLIRNYDEGLFEYATTTNSLIIDDKLVASIEDESGDFYYITDNWKREPVMHYGVTYEIYLSAYYLNEYTLDNGCRVVETVQSEYVGPFDITTAPARPTVKTIDINDGVISGSWGLINDKGSITTVYLTLYDSYGNSLGSDYQLEYSNLQSGTFAFPKVASGNYVIRATSVFRFNDGTQDYVIWSVKDGGDDGSSDNGVYRYVYNSEDITISVSEINLRYTRIKKGFIVEWDSASDASGYNLQVLNNGSIVYQLKDTKVLSCTMDWLDYSTEYTIQVQGIKSDGTTSDWTAFTTATAPPIPEISVVSCSSNSLYGAWTLEDPNSKFTYLYVTLYPVEG